MCHRLQALLAPLLIFLVVFALFAPSISYHLVGLDDGDYISDNPLIMEDSPFQALPACFTTFQQAMYAPFLWCSYAIDSLLFHASPAAPWGFHLTNVLLHAANAALLAILLSRLCKNRFLLFFCVTLWALHPLRCESVAWITERKDVLSGFFVLLASLAWLRSLVPGRSPAPPRGAKQSQNAPPAGFHLSLPFYLLSLVLFAAALLSKVSVAPWPVALLLLDVWPLRRIRMDSFKSFLRSAFGRLLEKIPFFILSFVAAALAAAAHGDMGAIRAMPFSERLASVPVHAAFYLLKTVLPLHLSPLYPDLSLSPAVVLSSLLLLPILVIIAFRLRRRAPAFLLGLCIFAVFFLPSSGIVRFGIQSIADRFTYLPAMGLSIALTALPLPARATARRLAFLFLLAVLAAFAGTTFHLLPVWRDDTSFGHRVLLCNPSQPHALSWAADIALKEGDLQTALARATEANAQKNAFTLQSPLSLALVLQEMNRPGDALQILEHVPRHATPPKQLYLLDWELARVHFALSQFDAALDFANRALATLPLEYDADRPFIHLLAMAAAHRAGRPGEALAHAHAFPAYASKTSVDEMDLLPHFLYEWFMQHRAATVPFFQPLVAPDADPSLANNLLWGFATASRSPFPAADTKNRAALLVKKAPSPNPSLLDTLAAAQARAGDFAAAQESIQQALALLEDMPASEARDRFALKLRRRLDLYRQSLPYTEEDAFSRWLANAYGKGLQTTSKPSSVP